LYQLSPLNHFIRYEAWRHDNTQANRDAFTKFIRNELPQETYIALADCYTSIGLQDDAFEILNLAPTSVIARYHLAWYSDQQKAGSGKAFLDEANQMPAEFVLPFHGTTAAALEWAIEASSSWKPRYYLGLIRWSRDDQEGARTLFAQCGDPY